MIKPKKTKEDKKAERRAKLLAGIDKFMGPEPTPESIKTRADISRAYNWYNYSCSIKQLIPWIIEFMKNSGKYSAQQLSAYKSVAEHRTSTTAGYIARMVNNGVTIPQDSIDWAHAKIAETLKYAPANKPKEKESAQVISIATRVRERTMGIIGDIEEEVDKFFMGGYISDFKAYDYMKKNDVKAVHAQKIASFYQPLREELKLAISGKDVQIKEGYAKLTKSNLKKYLEFIESIISDAESIAQIKKATRKTRKPKEKSATQLTSKMKYLKESSSYKIASIDPTRIIKSQLLIVFNTKYKKLGIYVAAGPEGLSVRGTSITGYDEKLSIAKTLRKPEEILPTTLNSSKSIINKMFTGLKTAAGPLNGRINEDTILIRAI
jgi:hypothetical protein